jgi:hypothetical protein
MKHETQPVLERDDPAPATKYTSASTPKRPGLPTARGSGCGCLVLLFVAAAVAFGMAYLLRQVVP